MRLSPDGVLVVDKARGPTSHDVVSVARRALATSRVGHTGTLDPMATGVLVLVVGRATRLARFMALDRKQYDAEVTFGRTTTTWDAEGAITADSGRVPSAEALAAAVSARIGVQMQTPPAYSAKKVGGEVAHRAARRDAPLELAAVPVTVEALRLDAYADGVARLAMTVSAGFYVRALAHELGAALGTGAFLSALRRTSAGAFDLASAVPFETLATSPRGGMTGSVLPLERLLPELPAARLTADAAARARHGQAVPGRLAHEAGAETGPGGGIAGPVRLIDEAERLVGIAERAAGPVRADGHWLLQPVVVLS